MPSVFVRKTQIAEKVGTSKTNVIAHLRKIIVNTEAKRLGAPLATYLATGND